MEQPIVTEKMFSLDDISVVLKRTRPEDILIHPTLFKVPLFATTVLERKDIPQSQDVVYRKNIYFLAKKTVNVFHFIHELIQHGLMNLSDKDRIMSWQDDTIRAMECYIIVVQQSAAKYDKLLHVLRLTKNDTILSVLESNKSNKIKKELPSKLRRRAPSPPKKATSTKQTVPSMETWICKMCTFFNTGVGHCEMCGYRRESTPIVMDLEEEAQICPSCTLINGREVIICEVCGYRLKEEPEELLCDIVEEDLTGL